MIRLVRNIAIVILCSTGLSYLFFFVLNEGLHKQKKDDFGTINYLVEPDTNHELIFIGASASKNDINPQKVDSVLNVNSYNFGFYWSKMNQACMILERYLNSNHPKPERVVLFITPSYFNSMGIFPSPTYFYPYFDDEVFVKFAAEYDSTFMMTKKVPFYAASKYTDYVRHMGLIGYIKKSQFDPLKGHDPQKVVASSKKRKMGEGKQGENIIKAETQDNLRYLEYFCKMTDENDIELYIVVPPYFHEDKEYPNVLAKFSEMIKPIHTKYSNATLMDYSESYFQDKREYFKDNLHLNSNGANAFSIMLSNDILKLNSVKDNE